MNLYKIVPISFILIIFNYVGFSQVGIGTTDPLEGTSLQINGENSGLLINRVSLLGTDDVTTIPGLTSELEGLMVYNTNTSSTGIASTEVVPGFYFWDGSFWQSSNYNLKNKYGWVSISDGNTSQVITGISLTESTAPINYTDIDINFSDSALDSSISAFAPYGYDSSDFHNDLTNRITPLKVGDAIHLRLQFTATPSSNNSFLIIAYDIGDPNGIIVFQKTIPLLRGSGQANRISESILLYQLGTFVANGAKLRIGYSATSGTPGTVTVSDFSYVISRISTTD